MQNDGGIDPVHGLQIARKAYAQPAFYAQCRKPDERKSDWRLF
jgi:hypothetical protein